MISRRTLLLAASGSLAAAGVAGCSRTAPERDAGTGGPTGASSQTPAPSARAAGPATPSPTSSVAAPSSRPSRAEIVSEFGGRRPQAWGLHTTGTVSRGSEAAVQRGLVALTFDACGGRGGSRCDTALIATLRRLRVPATLMLNSRWVAANDTMARELGADPLFEIQSHGTRHLPLSVEGRKAYGEKGTRSVGEVYDELTGASALLEQVAGKPVRWFRPGTAYCDDVAAAVARSLGTPVVDFSVNGDAGATLPPAKVASQLATVRAGDIVISHMNQPTHGTAKGYAAALPRLLDRGVVFAHLSEVASA